jgi:GTPase SAR1 family protein
MVKRIAVIGPHATGKTSIIHRYLHRPFSESYISTLFGEVYNDEQNNIIWDCPGHVRFMSTEVLNIVNKADGFILTFNPVEDDSFFAAIYIADQLEIGERPVVMAATQTDSCEWCIKAAWSSEARVRGWKIIRTSAATKDGISHVFKEIFEQTPISESVDLGRLEYAHGVMSSCIYTGINDYIYELDTDDS